MNGHADVACLACKQTRQLGPESNINDSSEDENVDSMTFALFSVKTVLA